MQHLGAKRYERTAERTGERNGTRERRKRRLTDMVVFLLYIRTAFCYTQATRDVFATLRWLRAIRRIRKRADL